MSRNGRSIKILENKGMNVTESTVEDAAVNCLGGLGYEVVSGLVIAPGEPDAERTDYKQVYLSDRLQTKLKALAAEA